MTILYGVLALFISIIWGWSFAMRGGAPPKLPRPIDQMLYTLPYAVVGLWLINWWAALIIWGLSTLAVIKGHGSYMTLGRDYWFYPDTGYPDDEEWIKWILDIIFGEGTNPGNFPRQATGLALTGLAVSLPLGVGLMIVGHVFFGLLVGLSGATKLLAYLIGWIFPKDINDIRPEPKTLFGYKGFFKHAFSYGTGIGEYLTGLFGIGSLLALLIIFVL